MIKEHVEEVGFGGVGIFTFLVDNYVSISIGILTCLYLVYKIKTQYYKAKTEKTRSEAFDEMVDEMSKRKIRPSDLKKMKAKYDPKKEDE